MQHYAHVKSPKKRDNFRLTLSRHKIGVHDYTGCSGVFQYAFSPQQAISSLVDKVGKELRTIGFTDYYITAWERDSDDVKISLEYRNNTMNLDNIPPELRRLESLRRFVAEKKSITKTEAKGMKYSELLSAAGFIETEKPVEMQRVQPASQYELTL